MNPAAVVVKNLSKVYKIYSHPGARIRELLYFGQKTLSHDYSALKDINFTIEKGDFIGVIGRNGAGKSTLLKILSGELTPTSGDVKVNGRVSILQLGVGFDPELSGRENAIFSSKLLGFQQNEIENILKKIQDFADIGEFFDHPVKTYSSGMYSRLSFAIAINVDPDILIADEILAVGDMRFAQKCLRKMQEFKEQGKTVILVTHDTNSIRIFCNKALWILDGKVFRYGDPKEISDQYRIYMLYNQLPGEDKKLHNPKAESSGGSTILWESVENVEQTGDSSSKILRVGISSQDRAEINLGSVLPSEKITVWMEVQLNEDFESPFFGYILKDKFGLTALHSNSNISGKAFQSLKAGKHLLKYNLPLPHFNTGDFIFDLAIGNYNEITSRVADQLPFSIQYEGELKSQGGYVLTDKDQFEIVGPL